MQLPYSNLQFRHQNPEASMPLILPIHVVCNTSDEQIFENIKINSRRPGKWQKLLPAHDGVAVLCGSGPSLVDDLREIRQKLRLQGAKLFAMNGAAKFLYEQGMLPDYQVIIDARPETAQLVGPAKEHLFGSQVHPDTFARAPDAKLWHLQVTGMDKYLPEYTDGYALVGGAASVGNCATCLAYTMGFREIHCYGYDSCHRDGKGHAFRQKMNDGDPMCSVRFNGKDYIASLTMKLQAEKFMETARELKALGVELHVHGSGLLPDMYNAPPLEEREKYQILWADPLYHEVAPGEGCVGLFLDTCKPNGPIIDFGCGTGRAALRITERTGYRVTLVDFVENSRCEAARHLPFVQADLSEPMKVRGTYGFCTDVMEHIPPEQVDKVINNIMTCVPRCFFQISYVEDTFGGLIGQPLHISLHDHAWWREAFEKLGYSILATGTDGPSGWFVVSK